MVAPACRGVLGLLHRLEPSLPATHPWSSVKIVLDAYLKTSKTYRSLLPPSPPLIFAHLDAQPGNCLRLTGPFTTPTMSPLLILLHELAPDHQIVVVDFEYASPNPMGVDVANHFHERCLDDSQPASESWMLHREWYHSVDQQRTFLSAYLGSDATPSTIAALEHEVRLQSPASHAMSALSGVGAGREDVEALL